VCTCILIVIIGILGYTQCTNFELFSNFTSSQQKQQLDELTRQTLADTLSNLADIQIAAYTTTAQSTPSDARMMKADILSLAAKNALDQCR
jgi:hypothetical protein